MYGSTTKILHLFDEPIWADASSPWQAPLRLMLRPLLLAFLGRTLLSGCLIPFCKLLRGIDLLDKPFWVDATSPFASSFEAEASSPLWDVKEVILFVTTYLFLIYLAQRYHWVFNGYPERIGKRFICWSMTWSLPLGIDFPNLSFRQLLLQECVCVCVCETWAGSQGSQCSTGL